MVSLPPANTSSLISTTEDKSLAYDDDEEDHEEYGSFMVDFETQQKALLKQRRSERNIPTLPGVGGTSLRDRMAAFHKTVSSTSLGGNSSHHKNVPVSNNKDDVALPRRKETSNRPWMMKRDEINLEEEEEQDDDGSSFSNSIDDVFAFKADCAAAQTSKHASVAETEGTSVSSFGTSATNSELLPIITITEEDNINNARDIQLPAKKEDDTRHQKQQENDDEDDDTCHEQECFMVDFDAQHRALAQIRAKERPVVHADAVAATGGTSLKDRLASYHKSASTIAPSEGGASKSTTAVVAPRRKTKTVPWMKRQEKELGDETISNPLDDDEIYAIVEARVNKNRAVAQAAEPTSAVPKTRESTEPTTALSPSVIKSAEVSQEEAQEEQGDANLKSLEADEEDTCHEQDCFMVDFDAQHRALAQLRAKERPGVHAEAAAATGGTSLKDRLASYHKSTSTIALQDAADSKQKKNAVSRPPAPRRKTKTVPWMKNHQGKDLGDETISNPLDDDEIFAVVEARVQANRSAAQMSKISSAPHATMAREESTDRSLQSIPASLELPSVMQGNKEDNIEIADIEDNEEDTCHEQDCFMVDFDTQNQALAKIRAKESSGVHAEAAAAAGGTSLKDRLASYHKSTSAIAATEGNSTGITTNPPRRKAKNLPWINKQADDWRDATISNPLDETEIYAVVEARVQANQSAVQEISQSSLSPVVRESKDNSLSSFGSSELPTVDETEEGASGHPDESECYLVDFDAQHRALAEMRAKERPVVHAEAAAATGKTSLKDRLASYHKSTSFSQKALPVPDSTSVPAPPRRKTVAQWIMRKNEKALDEDSSSNPLDDAEVFELVEARVKGTCDPSSAKEAADMTASSLRSSELPTVPIAEEKELDRGATKEPADIPIGAHVKATVGGTSLKDRMATYHKSTSFSQTGGGVVKSAPMPPPPRRKTVAQWIMKKHERALEEDEDSSSNPLDDAEVFEIVEAQVKADSAARASTELADISHSSFESAELQSVSLPSMALPGSKSALRPKRPYPSPSATNELYNLKVATSFAASPLNEAHSNVTATVSTPVEVIGTSLKERKDCFKKTVSVQSVPAIGSAPASESGSASVMQHAISTRFMLIQEKQTDDIDSSSGDDQDHSHHYGDHGERGCFLDFDAQQAALATMRAKQVTLHADAAAVTKGKSLKDRMAAFRKGSAIV